MAVTTSNRRNTDTLLISILAKPAKGLALDFPGNALDWLTVFLLARFARLDRFAVQLTCAHRATTHGVGANFASFGSFLKCVLVTNGSFR